MKKQKRELTPIEQSIVDAGEAIKAEERRKRKFLFCFFYVIATLICLLFIYPIGVCMLLPIMIVLLKFFGGILLDYIWMPFRFIRGVLTNSLPGSPNSMKGRYPNLFQAILFGIFGRILYYVIVLAAFTAIFSFRPYADGCIFKANTFEAGDEVVIKTNKGKFIATVENVEVSDEGSFVYANHDGKKIKANLAIFDGNPADGRVLGEYVVNDSNMFVNFWKSGWTWLVYMIKRVPRVIHLFRL